MAGCRTGRALAVQPLLLQCLSYWNLTPTTTTHSVSAQTPSSRRLYCHGCIYLPFIQLLPKWPEFPRGIDASDIWRLKDGRVVMWPGWIMWSKKGQLFVLKPVFVIAFGAHCVLRMVCGPNIAHFQSSKLLSHVTYYMTKLDSSLPCGFPPMACWRHSCFHPIFFIVGAPAYCVLRNVCGPNIAHFRSSEPNSHVRSSHDHHCIMFEPHTLVTRNLPLWNLWCRSINIRYCFHLTLTSFLKEISHFLLGT